MRRPERSEGFEDLCREIKVDGKKLVYGIQSHSDNILILKDSTQETFGLDKPVQDCDGFITNIKNLPLMVKFADCQGVLFFDPVKKVIAAVHSGWRGNVQNIIGKAARKMLEEFGCNAADILVGISQSLGPCHAEFSDPEKELPGWMMQYVGKNAGIKERHVDLWKCSFDQLMEAGILAKNIEILRRCTVCENDKFYSYRVEGEKAGRMGGMIELQGN